MIIKEIDNITYQINLPNSNINIYNKDSLERITKKIFKKITNKKKLNRYRNWSLKKKKRKIHKAIITTLKDKTKTNLRKQVKNDIDLSYHI